MKPYANESDTLQLRDFNVENRLDRVSLYGSLDLTRDKDGLVKAKALHELLTQVVKELESGPLPDKVKPDASEQIENPFAQRRE